MCSYFIFRFSSQILPTTISKNVNYVPPEAVNGYFVPSSSKKLGKRTNAGEKNIDVPLERRLDNLIVDVPSTVSAPESDSLVHLLFQVSNFCRTITKYDINL